MSQLTRELLLTVSVSSDNPPRVIKSLRSSQWCLEHPELPDLNPKEHFLNKSCSFGMGDECAEICSNCVISDKLIYTTKN